MRDMSWILLQNAILCGFDFLAVPLAHPRYRRPAAQRQPAGQLLPPFTRSDYLLSASQWSGQVGRALPHICAGSHAAARAHTRAS
jgi:hypothetical protein